MVTEHGVFDPRGLSVGERAVGIAHLAAPPVREELLRHVYDSGFFMRPASALSDAEPKGFLSCEKVLGA